MKFGGMLGKIRDRSSGALLSARCFGDATLADPSLEPQVKLAITRALAEHLAGSDSPTTAAKAPELAATIGAAVSAAVGSEVTITMLAVTFA